MGGGRLSRGQQGTGMENGGNVELIEVVGGRTWTVESRQWECGLDTAGRDF